ncbi:MAG: response regulator [Polyangiaceae bacterium]|nr:response regulator [Polyangiaceae bacterium]
MRERIGQLEAAATRDDDPILRALYEHAPSFLAVVSPEGRHIATGRTSEAYGNVIGRSVYEFTDPSSHETTKKAFERACATREPVVYEVLANGENGEPGHTYRVRAVPLCEKDEVRGLLLVPTDITDHVRLERSLIESTEALRLAVDASRMGFWRWEVADNRVEWDDRLLALFETSSTPAGYEEYLALIHPDDRDHVRGVVTEAWQTGVYRTFEHRIASRADGDDKWFLCVGTTRRGPNGDVATLQGGVLDITEKKSLASHLWRAERAQTISQLSSGFAHNFNNLLAVIVPHLEMAAEHQKGEAASAALEASLQARDLVRSMLALAGRRSGEETTPGATRELVYRVEAICRMTFSKEISLTTSVEPDVGAVTLPSIDLEQVLLNLLFNARDALEAWDGPERRIDVAVARVAEEGGCAQVHFRVTDTGPGIPEEIRSRIFEPFFTTKTSQRRAGLGLASSLARVQAVAGKLEVESGQPSKTTFTLILPELPSQSPSHDPSAHAIGHRETILIVDDEPLVRGVVRRLLESEGYRVHEAGSAAEARDVLGRVGSTVDVIILDQSMPREAGLEALPSLLSLTNAAVILFTGLVPDAATGAAAILEKPAMATDIFRVVREVLDRRHAR